MSRNSERIGVLLQGELPPGEIAEMSRMVEKNGFAELWLSEDYFMLSGFASTAIALQATHKVKVGLGAVANRVRHPAVTAMEAATIANAFPDRFYSLGIGHGVQAWMRQMKLAPKSLLDSFRECVSGVRRLLKGETLTEEGVYYTFDKVKLVHKAPGLKVMGAVVGPKSVDLVATVSDGLQISVLAGPRYIRAVADRIRSARAVAGLSPEFTIVTYVLTCVGHDRAEARRELRRIASFYIAASGPNLLTEVYGVNDALSAILKKGGLKALENEMPDAWLDWLGASGTPDEVAASINALFEAGSSSVVLCIAPPHDLPTQLELIGREVLPKV
jgi:5,10-methylenetetrahydromethanopterin reductase